MITEKRNSMRNNIPGYTEISSQDGLLTAISQKAKTSGIKDVIDENRNKRFLFFPFDAREVYQNFQATDNLLYIPQCVEVTTKGGTLTAYQIPLNTISLEIIDLGKSNQHSFSFDVEARIRSLVNKYNLPMETLEEYANYWSIDPKSLQLVFIPLKEYE